MSSYSSESRLNKVGDDKHHIRIIRKVVEVLKAVIFVLILLLGIVFFMGYNYLKSSQQVPTSTMAVKETPKIINGIHVQTGLIEGEGLQLVVQHCTSCHSSKLITQNRMSKTSWKATIEWMQETQNLWDLGDNEGPIINYLATNYAPEKKGRRARLENIEWYELD